MSYFTRLKLGFVYCLGMIPRILNIMRSQRVTISFTQMGHKIAGEWTLITPWSNSWWMFESPIHESPAKGLESKLPAAFRGTCGDGGQEDFSFKASGSSDNERP